MEIRLECMGSYFSVMTCCERRRKAIFLDIPLKTSALAVIVSLWFMKPSKADPGPAVLSGCRTLGPLRPLVQELYLKSVIHTFALTRVRFSQSPQKVDLLTHSFSEII